MPTKQKIKKRIIKKNSKKAKNELTQNHSGVLLEEMNSKIDLVLLTQIKSELKNKADLEYVKKLEHRVNKIEINYIELKATVMKNYENRI